jgi:hypothetical protein
MSGRRKSVTNDEITPLLSRIRDLLAEDTTYPLEGTLLYAQVERGAVSPAVFKDGAKVVVYRSYPGKLMYPLLDLWELADPSKRWAELEYVIKGGKFRVAFTYPDEIDLTGDDNGFERRAQIVRRHFGDRPIVYPSLSALEYPENF